MTAYARKKAAYDWGSAVWEIRSVNHRYLDANFRLPEVFRDCEGELRERLRKRVGRGKVECLLQYDLGEAASDVLHVNTALLEQLNKATKVVFHHIQHDVSSATELDYLRWPGVLHTEDEDFEPAKRGVIQLFEDALTEFVEAREREGAALASFIDERLKTIQALAQPVREHMPTIIESVSTRIKERFEQSKIELDPNRLEQEMVLVAQRLDVEEELSRLLTHLDEVRRALKQAEPVGRRLDFLMQELNREANTLSSKSIDTKVTYAALEAKVCVEQMREQVQNIE